MDQLERVFISILIVIIVTIGILVAAVMLTNPILLMIGFGLLVATSIVYYVIGRYI